MFKTDIGLYVKRAYTSTCAEPDYDRCGPGAKSYQGAYMEFCLFHLIQNKIHADFHKLYYPKHVLKMPG